MVPYDVLTFDCYGTLIDWESGISGAFLQAALEHGVRLGREDVLTTYAQVEPVIQARVWQTYRDVLIEAAGETAGRLGWSIDREIAGFLPESLPSWSPFGETNPVLERLAEQGLTLGILSNVDDDLLAGTRRHFSVAFDVIVTAQQVGSYKPAHGHFRRAAEIVGERRWLHVAQSYFHDIQPAFDLGIPSVWVNRKDEQPSGKARPTAEVGDLYGLLGWLGLDRNVACEIVDTDAER
jgi:2-haloalkanoic acid dehalogenase type II